MVALILLILGIYLVTVGKRQTGLFYETVDDVMGEDVASFTYVALGAIFIVLGACLGMLHVVAP